MKHQSVKDVLSKNWVIPSHGTPSASSASNTCGFKSLSNLNKSSLLGFLESPPASGLIAHHVFFQNDIVVHSPNNQT